MNELKFILINKLIIQFFVLIFFILILLINKVTRYKLSLKLVYGTIYLSLLGLILIIFSYELKDIPIYGKTSHIIQNLITLICFANFFNYLIGEVFLYFKFKGNTPSFLKSLFTILVYFLFSMISLRLIFNVEISSIITTSAVLTAGIAFAMQNTLANIISGLSIQLDKNLKVGNWIYIKDKDVYGEITNVGFRYVTLKTLENTVYIIPNNQLLQSTINVFEKTSDGFALYTSVGLRYEVPPEQAKKIITEVILKNSNISKKNEPKVYHYRFGDSAIEYKIKFYISDFSKKDVILDSIHTQLWYAIKRNKLDFPYPHREIIKNKYTSDLDESINLEPYLEKVPLFSLLDESQKVIILTKSKKKRYASGEIVVKEGEEGNSLFIVLKGELNVFINNNLVGILKEGDFFGEYSLLTGEKRKADVITTTESLLLEIEKDALMDILKTSQTLVNHLEEFILKRDRESKAILEKNIKDSSVDIGCESVVYKFKKFFGLIK